MTRSFRFHLAARFTAAMAVAVAVIAITSFLAFRAFLDRELNVSILEVASIQGAAVTDSPSGGMHFHEWELSPGEAESVRDLIRYAQIWSESGESLLRSRFVTEDLPLDREALAEAGRSALVWREQTFAGAPIRSLFYPLSGFGAAHASHVIQVAAPLSGRNDLMRRVAFFFALLSVVVTSASFGGSWWLAGRAVRPIHEVIDQAEGIGSGSLDRRISAYADTQELHRLVAVLNTMLDRIEHSFHAQQRFAADASHELRSPLTALRGEIELAVRRERSPEEYRRVLESSLEEIVRLSRITEDLLMLARLDAGGLRGTSTPADVGRVAEQVVDRLRGRAAAKQIDLKVHAEVSKAAAIDPGFLWPIVWNLTDNALKFTPVGGSVRIEVLTVDQNLEISVSDTGPGLGGDPARLFDRFVKSDAARTPGADTSGTGLGLAIVKSIAEGCGGGVDASSSSGGACIRVLIPTDRGGVAA